MVWVSEVLVSHQARTHWGSELENRSYQDSLLYPRHLLTILLLLGMLWGNGRKRNRIGSTGGTTVDGEEGDETVEDDDTGMELS